MVTTTPIQFGCQIGMQGNFATILIGQRIMFFLASPFSNCVNQQVEILGAPGLCWRPVVQKMQDNNRRYEALCLGLSMEKHDQFGNGFFSWFHLHCRMLNDKWTFCPTSLAERLARLLAYHIPALVGTPPCDNSMAYLVRPQCRCPKK